MSILMTVVGQKQGQIYGAGPNREWSVLSHSWGITTPVDQISGLPAGKRQHKPCIVALDYGENITSLMKSISNAEDLTVTLTYTDDSTGETQIRIILTNGQLFDFEFNGGGGDEAPKETVTFSYGAIQFTAGNTAFQDTWEGGSSTGA